LQVVTHPGAWPLLAGGILLLLGTTLALLPKHRRLSIRRDDTTVLIAGQVQHERDKNRLMADMATTLQALHETNGPD
jgi:hypothetical protein